jgi:transposase
MTPTEKVYLVSGVTDMRKSIDGLSLIVSDALEIDSFSESWLIFCNRGRDKLKILFWDTNVFWLYYRRLEKDTFKLPKPSCEGAIHITRPQLYRLLSGLTVDNH